MSLVYHRPLRGRDLATSQTHTQVSEMPNADEDALRAIRAAITALQQLCTEAENDPDAAADAVLTAPSIWRCCSSEARTPAWKCGGCN